MSNDAKFWVWRIVMAALLFINFGFLSKAVGEAMKPDGHVIVWALIFFVSIAASIYVGFLYMAAKNKRWQSAYTPYPEVEALEAHAKQQAQEGRSDSRSNK
ncbi:MAG TPA: hypothetical protein VJ836_06095 [Candidatus Saccharimonadales bacterium]|nr:hypothetical protein [Candidatus Saccharimonadales bacterium]